MTLRLNGSTSGYTEIDAPAVAGSNTLVLPTGNGTNGQVLTTNGSGALSWGSNGKILQVVSTTWQSAFSSTFTNTVWTELSTSIRASITLSSSTNKVLVLLYLGTVSADCNTIAFRLYRDSSEVTGASGTSSNSRPTAWTRTVKHPSDTSHAWGLHASYLDTPGSSGSKTYQIYVRPEGVSGGTQVVYINQDPNSGNTDNVSECITSSTLTLMEVSA